MTGNGEVVMAVGTPSRAKSRFTLLLVFGLFAAPVVFAWLAFFVYPDWRPDGSTNHGELIQPPRSLHFAPFSTVEGAALDEDFLQGKWTYVLWAGRECGNPCLEQLVRMHQVRLAQGKNIDRVQALLLVQGMEDPALRELQWHYPNLKIAHGGATQMHGLLREFQLAADEDVLSGGRLYLVDPMGNLMMRYQPDAAPRGIVKDLERLLRISYVG
jgi:hypothetical protein